MDIEGFKSSQRNRKEIRALKKELKFGALVLFSVLSIMWGLVGLDWWIDSVRFSQFGIDPRSWGGIPAIVYAHFLHLSPLHLLANSIPFVILGALVLMRDIRDFFAIGTVTIFVSGLSVWLFGTEVTRVGSGAIICGFLGYLLVWGFLERSWMSLIVSAGVGMLYFGTFLSALNPFHSGSWVATTSALATGVVVGRFMNRNFKSHLTKSVTDD